jgi:hypothetical protein
MRRWLLELGVAVASFSAGVSVDCCRASRRSDPAASEVSAIK